jgi:hypothetical protein
MRFRKFLSQLAACFAYLQGSKGTVAPSCNIYRINQIKQTSSGQYLLTIKVIKNRLYFERSPQSILANDKMLEGFSKSDVRTIAYLACEQSRRPKYKVIMQEFCDRLNRILFKLKHRESSEIICKTAGQITLDKQLINNLSQEDVCSIGFVAGYEQSLIENFRKEDFDQ